MAAPCTPTNRRALLSPQLQPITSSRFHPTSVCATQGMPGAQVAFRWGDVASGMSQSRLRLAHHLLVRFCHNRSPRIDLLPGTHAALIGRDPIDSRRKEAIGDKEHGHARFDQTICYSNCGVVSSAGCQCNFAGWARPSNECARACRGENRARSLPIQVCRLSNVPRFSAWPAPPGSSTARMSIQQRTYPWITSPLPGGRGHPPRTADIHRPPTSVCISGRWLLPAISASLADLRLRPGFYRPYESSTPCSGMTGFCTSGTTRRPAMS